MQDGEITSGVPNREFEETGRFCHPATILNEWWDKDWTEGVQVDTLQILDRVFVWTANSLYELTVISPSTGEVLVSGGQFFPEARNARLAGSSLGGSFLKLRGIYVGLRMELIEGDQTILTGQVQTIATSVE